MCNTQRIVYYISANYMCDRGYTEWQEHFWKRNTEFIAEKSHFRVTKPEGKMRWKWISPKEQDILMAKKILPLGQKYILVMVSKNLVMLKVSSKVSLQKKSGTIFRMSGLLQYRDHRPVISILSFLINLNHQSGGAPDEKRKETTTSFLLGLHSPYKTVSLSYQLGCPAEYNCN